MSSLILLRLRKVAYCLLRPLCWRALARRVAPSLEHRSVIESLDCDLLLDAGANRGQFSLMFRLVHPGTPIHAFEPLPGEAAVYRRVMQGNPHCQLHEVALGDAAGTADLHVSGRADSSSLLPITGLQERLFPHTGEVAVHPVDVRPLDSLPETWSSASRALLKLDVQGYELSVLKGSRHALKHCAYVYAECSEVTLYEGQALFPEVAGFLAGEGFRPVLRANEQFDEGRLIQADHLFARRP
jgi:FkbM family methyltransferase